MFNIKQGEESYLDFYSFMRTYKKELNEKKLKIVAEVFSHIDTNGGDKVNLNVIKMKYNASKHPEDLMESVVKMRKLWHFWIV